MKDTLKKQELNHFVLGEKSKLRYSNNSLIAFSVKDNRENGVKGGKI